MLWRMKSVNLSILQKTINKTSKSPHAFVMCSIRTDIDSLQKKHFDIDCLYHRQGNEQKQEAVHQI
jgi:hypothetical protein